MLVDFRSYFAILCKFTFQIFHGVEVKCPMLINVIGYSELARSLYSDKYYREINKTRSSAGVREA